MTNYQFFELEEPKTKEKDHQIYNQTKSKQIKPNQSYYQQNQSEQKGQNYEEQFQNYQEQVQKEKSKEVQNKFGKKQNSNPNQIKSNIKNIQKNKLLDKRNTSRDKDRRSNSTERVNENNHRFSNMDSQFKTTYISRVQIGFPQIDLQKLNEKQIQKQLQKIRLKIKEFNEDLNKILERNKNYLYTKQSDSKQKNVNVERVIENLELTKQNNRKMLYLSELDIKKYKTKLEQLQSKDKVINFQQEIQKTNKMIEELKKENRHIQVKIQKVEKNIQQVQLIDQSAQMKKINDVKLQINHFNKKCAESEIRQAQISETIQNLTKKQIQLQKNYLNSKKIAQDNSLQVTSNKIFIQNKRKFNQLKSNEDQIKRGIGLLQKRQKQIEQNLQKQIQDQKMLIEKYQENKAIKDSQIKIIEKEIKEERQRNNIEQKTKVSTWKAHIPEKPRYVNESQQKNEKKNQMKEELKSYKNTQIIKSNEQSNNYKSLDNNYESFIKPPISLKRRQIKDQIKGERQWKKQDITINENNKNNEIQYALQEKKEIKEKQKQKQIFRFIKRKNQQKKQNFTNVTVPVILSTNNQPEQKNQDTKQNQIISFKPPIFKKIKKPDVGYSSLISLPEQKDKINQSVIVQNTTQKVEVKNTIDSSKQKLIMLKPFGKKKNIEQKLPQQKFIQPTMLSPINNKNPFIKDYQQKNVLKIQKATKIKIQKPKLKKYDIFDAQQIAVNDIQHKEIIPNTELNQPKNPSYRNQTKNVSLEELIGQNTKKRKENEYDDLIVNNKIQKKQIKKGGRQNDFFGDLDV